MDKKIKQRIRELREFLRYGRDEETIEIIKEEIEFLEKLNKNYGQYKINNIL